MEFTKNAEGPNEIYIRKVTIGVMERVEIQSRKSTRFLHVK